jgi:FtsZ-binding cell division protein ZapB
VRDKKTTFEEENRDVRSHIDQLERENKYLNTEIQMLAKHNQILLNENVIIYFI